MLDALFKPKAVAIVGASTKELSIGNVIIRNLQEYGYKGEIYPINPNGSGGLRPQGLQVAGRDPRRGRSRAHHHPQPSSFPRRSRIAARKGVKAVIINSAGFSEMGEEGAQLQEQFLANARKYGVRVFGPTARGSSTPILR